MDNKPLIPDPDLADLVQWSDYWRSLPNLFSSKSSASHFITTRKAKLIEQDILIEAFKGYLIRKSRLDAVLLELLKGDAS